MSSFWPGGSKTKEQRLETALRFFRNWTRQRMVNNHGRENRKWLVGNITWQLVNSLHQNLVNGNCSWLEETGNSNEYNVCKTDSPVFLASLPSLTLRFQLSIRILSVFLEGSPDGPCMFIVIYKGGKRFFTRLKNRHFWTHFFLLVLRFRSKLKQGVYISPFVNHLMLKNLRALNTFFHVSQMKMCTWDKIVICRNFCSPLSFF